jgi:hypothetical protein
VEIGLHIDEGCAGCDQFVAQTGEELVEHLPATGEQGVRMATLGHAAPRDRLGGQLVALDHRDSLETLAERTCREQSSHRCADDDGVSVTWRNRLHRSSFGRVLCMDRGID